MRGQTEYPWICSPNARISESMAFLKLEDKNSILERNKFESQFHYFLDRLS